MVNFIYFAAFLNTEKFVQLYNANYYFTNKVSLPILKSVLYL